MVFKSEISQYIAELNRIFKAGNATEHSYRPALKSLLENLTSGLTITNEPKRIDCGAPDYIVTRGEIPVGYIEAKDIGENLNDKKHKQQFDRYKRSLNNLIITDYLTFQLFENGEQITSVAIAKIDKNSIKVDAAQFDTFVSLVNHFVGYDGQNIWNSEHLSKVMATKAKLMASIIESSLSETDADSDTSIFGQMNSFRDYLIPNITTKEFSDIYAHTIAYGMFAAKLNSNPAEPFNRSAAAHLIPHTNPFLRRLFQFIAGYDLDERIRWVVDDLADIFNHVDITAIIQEFGKSEHDPIIHFYETFLAQYDPALRKSRGVWYTPQPVVKFIVQAVDDLLKNDFAIPQGLADASKVQMKQHIRQSDGIVREETRDYHRVQILDPATGTGTFLAEVVQSIFRNFRGMEGIWQSYAKDHLIPRVNGFEILMASYTMAHLKLDMLLQQSGYKHSGGERLKIYLTNSLDEARAKSEIPFAQWLANEANEASHVKRDVPVMVVLGNPPYCGESQNSGKWMNGLMNDYKKEPSGIRLQEKNSKWINDDYVKFIRFGQYFINENGEGVLAFINNHSFLDNPTFRGMRWNLLNTFDKIFILDLHGNAKKKETSPDGSADENVFDIQQGVSINIFVKYRNTSKSLASVYHTDLYGKRADKYSFLLNNNLQTVQWQKLKLVEPQYYFVPKDFSLLTKYEKGFSVQELFTVNGTGIVSKRDNLAFQDTKNAIIEKVRDIYSLSCEEIKRKYDKISWDSRDGKVEYCKNNVLTYGLKENLFVRINYRPFDIKWTYYTGVSKGFIGWPVKQVMKHFLKGKNVGLMVCRQQKTNGFFHCLVHDKIVESSFVSNNTSEIGYSFPLYLYTSDNLFENGNRVPNLDLTIIKKISRKLKLRFTEEKEETEKTFAPIDVLDYIYAVLHSPAYRECYKEFLKIDFPRVPYPENAEKFWSLTALGEKLRRLHLMEDIEPQVGIANFPITGSNEVEKLQYIGNKVFINDTQYFEHVPPEAWNFYIGGYQPAQKWLKDRKVRTLGYDDIVHYQKVIRVLKETGEVMREVDEVTIRI